MTEPAPIDILDDGLEYPRIRVLVIGCGNILRGDDAAGPVLIRRLWERGGIPDDVRLADGGTSGMDVAFQMRHADRVIIVDAASTDAAPGTVYRVPGEVVAELPAAGALGSHDFRWDHAIALGRWLLGNAMPTDVQVYLIEGEGYGFGDPLTDQVSEAVDRVAERIVSEVAPA